MDFLIREAQLKDLNRLVELLQKLFENQLSKDDYYQGDFKFLNGEALMTEAINSEKCGLFVAEKDGGVVGFVEVWLHEKDFYFFIDDYAYILNFFIDDPYRSGKYNYIGLSLLRAAEEWGTKQGKKFLAADVFEHNQKIMKHLEYKGFKKYRTRLVKVLGNRQQ
jgi:GNAT superfamily N-acetyltransferase